MKTLSMKLPADADIWQRLADSSRPAVLYGTGDGADKILDECERRKIRISGVFASDGFVRSRTFRGFPVLSYDEAVGRFPDMTVLVAFGSSRPDVIQNIRRIADKNELLIPDVPVFGGGIFDSEYAKKHAGRLQCVYDRLCDDESRRCFESLISFRLQGKMSELDRAVTMTEDDPVTAPCGGLYMDIGAYDGDTVLEYAKRNPHYGYIYAVEPDEKNFSKLCENTSQLKNIELHNSAIYSRGGEVSFASKNGRNSSVSESGLLHRCESIDGILMGSPIDFIKLDVEGQEKNALLGGVNSIKKFKPKLKVAAYHRTEDYFDLPETVLSIRDDYRLFMRHSLSIPAWDTDFYFI